MSYPKTSEQRLIELYGYSKLELFTLFLTECGKNKTKYIELVEKLDTMNAAKCYTEMMDENTFVH